MKFVVFLIFSQIIFGMSSQDDYQYFQDVESSSSLTQDNYLYQDDNAGNSRYSIDSTKDHNATNENTKPLKSRSFDLHATNRISGGFRPPEHTLVKYLVSIRYRKPKKFFGDNHVCGGVIIEPNVVMSAAHCFIQRADPSRWVVVAGTPQRLFVTSSTKIVKVARILPHRQFDIQKKAYDIAMLILSDPIIFDNYSAEAIDIQVEPLLGGEVCTVIGWGRVYYKGPLSNDALYVSITVWPQKKCKLWLQHQFHNSMMCAGDSNDYEKDACQADSGGPLICGEKVSGIVSFGYGCATPGFAGVYTNVSALYKWIYRHDDYSRGSKLIFGIFFLFSLLVFVC